MPFKAKKQRVKQYRLPPSAEDFPEYKKLVEGLWVHGEHDIDPIQVLTAAHAPHRVIVAAQHAIAAGCKVKYRVMSSHVGWFSDIVFHGPMPIEISNELTAIDASGLRDYSFRTTSRWYNGDWSWTLVLG